MTLNFSHHPIFPSNLSGDNLLSSMKIANGYVMEGIPEKKGSAFCGSGHHYWGIDDPYDYGRDKDDMRGSCETVSNDILDLLPSDPFGMDISATFTAITGWFGELEADSKDYRRDEIGAYKGDYHLLAGLNFIWNRALRFHPEPGIPTVDVRSTLTYPQASKPRTEPGNELGDRSCDCGFASIGNVEGIMSFGNENPHAASCLAKESWEVTRSSRGDIGAPHEGFLFALGYLGVQELLSAEQVCISLYSTIKSDALLWKSIHINKPLSDRLTDGALLHLTSRAQGNLHCLSLMECSRVTDDGLKLVLESNPRLTKLNVAGCTRLSIEGIVNNLKAFKCSGAYGIKQLRIGGLYGVTHKHFEELIFLLGEDKNLQPKARKPHFYHSGNLSLSLDDDRALDIEVCPRCENLRLVYNCPAESCQGTMPATQSCRACTLCIARCVQCGRCINDGEYEETFCLDLLCSVCGKMLPSCEQGRDEKDSSSRYCFHMDG